MNDNRKTKQQLLEELNELRARVSTLEHSEKDEREQRALAEALAETAATLNSTLDLEEVLKHILDQIGRVMPHDTANILLIDEESDGFRIASGPSYTDYGVEAARHRVDLLDTPTLRQMAETMQSIVISDTQDDPMWTAFDDPQTSYVVRSYVGAPICQKGNLIGFISCNSTKPAFYTPVHAEQLGAFANQAAVAIENARLYDLAQKEITERKRVGKELRDTTERLDRALTGAGLGEWTYDVKARTLLISRRRAELLGFSLSEVGEAFPQHEWQDWVHPDDLDRIAPKIQELLSGQTNLLELEIRVRAKSGEWRWTMHRGTIVERDDDGSPLLIVGMMNDITERKQTEQRRLELELEKERVQILSNFITQASHEFRTPLTIIGTGAYLLKRTDDSDKKARHIYNIENQVKFINTLIDALTTMAKLDGIRELTTEEVDLRGIITTVHETQQQTLQSKDIHSTLELETQPLLVQADIDYLQQAIEAIVDNAVHFTPEGGTITICASSSDGNAIIEIIDTGVGIDADDLSHIFERFYRADKAGTTRGFGLGLPIAKRILELHQGRIEVESMLEQGSTFRILMPLSG